MDFPHQQLTSPFLLPTLHVVDEPLEFLVAGIEHVTSWSEMEGQLSSSPRWKEEMRAAEKSSTNSCAVVVPWQRHSPPLNIEPNLSCDLLLFASSPPLLVFFAPLSPVFSAPPFLPLSPVFSALPFLPLCELNARGIPFLPAVEAGLSPQHVFLPTQPCKTRHRSQRG